MSAVLPDLPRVLQPWQGWLGWFDAALAPQVGEMVRRLSELLGPAPSAGRAGLPEPEAVLPLDRQLPADVAILETLRRHLADAPAVRP